MFESDQFHHFIDSTTSATNPTFPIPFHASSSSATISAFSTFDSHPHDVNFKNLDTTQTNTDRSVQEWSTDETLTLLRIRSAMENNWFPDFTWDNVSRKLAQFGYKKSADKCKEKFEEESRYFNNINFSKNYRVFGEFEDLYQTHDNDEAEKNKPNQEQEDKIDQTVVLIDEKSKTDTTTKRKRDKISSSSSDSSFEMFKGFCQDIVGKIIAQQEQMHNKLLENMSKRDEEKLAREEEWKKQELDRFDKELQLRAQQQALSSDRQTTIINFLKIYSNPNLNPDKDSNFSTPKTNPIKPNSIQSPNNQNPNSPSKYPISPLIPNTSISASTDQTVNKKDDIGKRWPKDEVLALINLRCSNSSSTNEEDNKEKESSVRESLWERISKGMMELGYRRSAKRCKEKWENINKYFRKTKDVNKKRSLDSRTCPYFHQLNTLYNQGKLAVASTDVGTQSIKYSTSIHEGEKILAQASGLEFEF